MTRNGNTTCWPCNRNYARPRRASSFSLSPSLSLSFSPATAPDYSSESVRSASRTNSFSPVQTFASVTGAFVRSQLSRYLTRINRNVLRLLEDSIDHPFQLVAPATFSTASFYTFPATQASAAFLPLSPACLCWLAWLTLARSHPSSSSPVAPSRAT